MAGSGESRFLQQLFTVSLHVCNLHCQTMKLKLQSMGMDQHMLDGQLKFACISDHAGMGRRLSKAAQTLAVTTSAATRDVWPKKL